MENLTKHCHFKNKPIVLCSNLSLLVCVKSNCISMKIAPPPLQTLDGAREGSLVHGVVSGLGGGPLIVKARE